MTRIRKMTRCEENSIIINEINKVVESKPSGEYHEMTLLQLSIIATTLMDISKSLAVLADEAEGEM